MITPVCQNQKMRLTLKLLLVSALAQMPGLVQAQNTPGANSGGRAHVVEQTSEPGQIRIIGRVSDRIEVQRDRDGMFYVDGAINNVKVHWMIDSGAKLVTIDRSLADRVGINASDGKPVTVMTASGKGKGFVAGGLTVSAGALKVADIDVGVHSFPKEGVNALLGQNFLSLFQLSQQGNTLILKKR